MRPRLLGLVRVALTSALVLGSCTLRAGTTVHAIFEDVGDLVNRSSVQFADVKIGSVTSIELDGYQARVTMRIDPTVDLPGNSSAVVRSTSLLGEKFVEIAPPTGQQPAGRLSDGDVIPVERTGKRASLEDVFLELGAILEAGGISELAAFIDSSAAIFRGREDQLGAVFAELRQVTGVLASHGSEIAAAVESLDQAFGEFGDNAGVLSSAIDSSADAARILADHQQDLDRLISALSRFAGAAAEYSEPSVSSSDRALKDLREVLDELMKSTDDLDASLTALARFVDLWPRVIPSDYIQLDVVVHGGNARPSSTSAGTATLRRSSVKDLIWEATR